MAIVDAKQMLIRATEEKYAVGAFNITNLIQMEAVVDTAVKMKAPLIIQTSVAPSKFLKPDVLAGIYRTLAESAPIPICLHLDHCTDVDHCKTCADAGYTNIMIDAYKKEFEENIKQTREVCEYCHSKEGISVEGELGTVSGVEDQIKVAEDEAALCDPEQALEFVEHAKSIATRKIAMLLPLEFLQGKSRYEFFQDKAFPLKVVYVFSSRLSFGQDGTAMVGHAWYVWHKRYKGKYLQGKIEP